jgi:hypothetical protein
MLGTEGGLLLGKGSVVFGMPNEDEELTFRFQYGFQALKAGGDPGRDDPAHGLAPAPLERGLAIRRPLAPGGPRKAKGGPCRRRGLSYREDCCADLQRLPMAPASASTRRPSP